MRTIDLTDETILEKLKTYKVFAVLWMTPRTTVELPIGVLAGERDEEREENKEVFVRKN